MRNLSQPFLNHISGGSVKMRPPPPGVLWQVGRRCPVARFGRSRSSARPIARTYFAGGVFGLPGFLYSDFFLSPMACTWSESDPYCAITCFLASNTRL